MMIPYCSPALRMLAGLALTLTPSFAELTIPAFTAYTLPNPDGARISERAGITGWNDPTLSVNWYGEIKQAGDLTAKVTLQLPVGSESKLRLTLAGKSSEVTVKGAAEPVTADFGSFPISQAGYLRIILESQNPAGQAVGSIKSLVLDGSATEGAHFNLKERRNAASVHLSYKVPEGNDYQAYYSEVTAVTDPTATFYMACGFHRGYFGMQVNSPTERRIIFSVWDSGNEAHSRDKVGADDRVKLVAKGDGVFTGDFGNEGTGGHSHLKYLWKTGETQRFLLTAKPDDATHTTFAGYYFHPEKKEWMLISAWKAPKEGGWLKGFHGFSENFWGSSGHIVRKSLHGNQWVQTSDGKWIAVTQASFSHDGTGRSDRLDRFMGVENDRFFLSHGGFVPGFTRYGELFTRPSNSQPPADFKLPALPTAAAGLPATLKSLLGSEWTLVDLCGSKVMDGSKASLSFSKEDQVAGNASVNRFFGTFKVEGETLKAGPFGSTQMAGPPEAMKQESTYLTALMAATAVVVEQDKLTISCKGNDKPLVFVRSKP